MGAILESLVRSPKLRLYVDELTETLRREQADGKQHSVRETVSRTGVTQEGWFSISG